MSVSVDDDETEHWRQVVREHGSFAEAARQLGKPVTTLKGRLGRMVDIKDPGTQSAMAAVNTQIPPDMIWAKTDKAGNLSYSVRFKPDSSPSLDDIREAFDGVRPAKPVKAPAQVLGELCTLYPLFDAHVGMLAWGRETGGQDYDLCHAADDMRMALAKVLALTPKSRQAILLVGGDYLHADDDTAQTPASKHSLDVDGRHFKVLEVGVAILAETIQSLLSHHESVMIRVLRGNHDPHAHMVMTFALAERYREEPRVNVGKDPGDLFMHQWGKSAIFAHHGDKLKPINLAMAVSDACPFYSETRHRHFFTGHVHHDSAKDFPGIKWESVRAFCPPDAYGALFRSKRSLQAITFHENDGIVLRAMDPIQR